MKGTYDPGLADALSGFFQKYGLAFVMVASYFGSGSIFIASEAGVEYGYTLIWAVIGAVLLGVMAQDMSARLGIFGDSLMVFTRRKLGSPLATALALLLSVGCIAWTLGLTAAVGAGVSFLLGGALPWQPIAVAAGLTAIVVGLFNYAMVERIMTAMMLLLLVVYVVVAGVSDPSPTGVASGFVPGLPGIGALPIAVAILGTTALWPNFFLESILVEEKGWTEAADLPTIRRDLIMGYGIGGLTTIAILIVAAAVLQPAGFEEIESFLTPGLALADVLGQWAMLLFLLGATAAAFNSIIPIMWAPAYLILEARGRDVTSSDRDFKLIYVAGVAIGTASPLIHELFGLGVIDMVILFPAYNGIVGLPITAALLLWAVNDTETMGERTNSRKLNLVNAILVVISIVLAILSAPTFVEAITTGGR